MGIFRIADALIAFFLVRSTFLELATLENQMFFTELMTTCPLLIHIKIITKIVKLWCRTTLRRGCPPPWKWQVKLAAFLCLAATAGMRVPFFQSCSILMKTTWNCLFIDTNIDMYVPFGKSVDDVTFRLSLRHLFFCPWWKKLWSITKALYNGTHV